MKRSTQTVYWALFLSVVLLIPSFAQDNTSAGKQATDNENRYETAANQLNLSAEQKEKIKVLRQNQRQQMTELRQALKEKRLKLKDELNNPGAIRESIAPLANDIKTILAKMVDQRIEGILAVKGILTPDQFSQLQARQQSRKDERGCRPFWLGKKRAGKTADQDERE